MEDVTKFTGEFAESVTVVTVEKDGKPNAMTAAWAVPVSHRPPLVVVHIAPQRYTHDIIMETKEFGLCILADDQMDISQHAGTVSGKKADKFGGELMKRRPSKAIGAPVLDGCAVTMECKLVNTLELGTHSMFIGEIMDVKCDSNVLSTGGNVDVAKLQPFVYSTVDSTYYAANDVLGKGYELGRQIGS